jgi:hypothetical protein
MSTAWCGCDPQCGDGGYECELHREGGPAFNGIKSEGVEVKPSQYTPIELKQAQQQTQQLFKELKQAQAPRPAGDPRFHALLREMGAVHDRKQIDYGTNADPFANVRGASEWGLRPWVGAMVRISDKVRRLQAFARKGSLANESAEDSLMDIAVYALIALILLREEKTK